MSYQSVSRKPMLVSNAPVPQTMSPQSTGIETGGELLQPPLTVSTGIPQSGSLS